MRRLHPVPIFAGACFLLLGCAHRVTFHDIHLPPDAFTVSEEALHEVTADGFIIPEKYWGAPIRALKPLGVYRDLVNIAIITSRTEHEERGVYFYVSASSYLPFDEPGRKFHWNKKAGHLEYVFAK